MYQELQRKDIVDLRRQLNDEVHEKESVEQSNGELRAKIKRAEADKTDLSRALADTKQKASGWSLLQKTTEVSLYYAVNVYFIKLFLNF